MLSFDEILGHPGPTSLLRRMIETGRLPHALLFHGPENVGKSTVATIFAATLLCEEDRDQPCGQCASCRMFDHGSHPDLLRVGLLPKGATTAAEAVEDADSADLRSVVLISQIRELCRLAGLAPRHGRRRVFVVDPADRMNLEAQNGLLKTLEEPPGKAVVILVASRPHLLLPTVRSRSFAVGFSALRAAELSRLLVERGVPPEEAGERAALAEGRVGRALDVDLSDRRERRDQIVRILEALTSGPASLGDLPAMATALAGKDEASLLSGLDVLQGLLRDTARVQADRESVLHVDLKQRLSEVGRRLDPPRAASLIASIERLRGYTRFNTNRTLIAESLLAGIAGGPLP